MKNRKKHLDVAQRNLIAFTTPRSLMSEQYRTLRTNINFSSIDQDIKSIVITSAAPSEGKSTTASNLAIVYAQEGKNVLLIDGDMRRPTMHNTFNIRNIHGLSSVLSRQSSIESSVRVTAINGLDILTCGPIPPNPAELLSSDSMDILIAKLKTMYDLLIFDSPPILSVADSQILINKCDSAILVLSSGETVKHDAIKAKEIINSSKSKLLGVVLNNVTLSKKSMYNSYLES
ncbi:CpsD/CapB family tyrosine-protein kinase [Metaplanococcus flavidus]|uniref:non-specific protein-tyrosine kinase n=1 Tax=Metaplanococcus flavidus TaxID=569883 RepID=A0ABW3LD41_9BACL